MSSALRFEVISKAFEKKPLVIPNREDRPSEFFAKYVFNRQKMFKYLPAKVYKKMCDVIDNGTTLDLATADAVAEGMKRWAMELGATHCTHWFQPLTEGTAEKHDGFVSTTGKAAWWRSSPASNWFNKSQTPAHSQVEVSVPLSRLVDIPHGILPAQYS